MIFAQLEWGLYVSILSFLVIQLIGVVASYIVCLIGNNK